jgi:hypothetical protein
MSGFGRWGSWGRRGAGCWRSRWFWNQRRWTVESGLHRVWQFIRMRQEQADLPHLGLRQRLAETRHSAEPDAVRDLPIGFGRLIVGYAGTFEQLWWLGIHSPRDRSRRAPRQAVAHRAVFPVNLCPGCEVGFVRELERTWASPSRCAHSTRRAPAFFQMECPVQP